MNPFDLPWNKHYIAVAGTVVVPGTKCVAFHSYKGGTGKTTIASNCAALLAKRGSRVALLDMDVYAPSLLTYFDRSPRKWLNEYLLGGATVDEVMTDATDSLRQFSGQQNKNSPVDGTLWIGFCNTKKEDVYRLEAGSPENSKMQLRRFIVLRDNLIRDYNLDYLLIDTSPGIRYWSINALAVADTLLLTLKVGEIDIEGTKRLASEIYGSLVKYGTKSFLLFNRVAGYCTPSPHGTDIDARSGSADMVSLGQQAMISKNQISADPLEETLSRETKMDVISAIPCYCDIQFSRKEFLTALQYPDHPFTKQLESLIAALDSRA